MKQEIQGRSTKRKGRGANFTGGDALIAVTKPIYRGKGKEITKKKSSQKRMEGTLRPRNPSQGQRITLFLKQGEEKAVAEKLKKGLRSRKNVDVEGKRTGNTELAEGTL